MIDWRAPAVRAQRTGLGVVLLLGALDAWRYINYQANPDGVSYIDLARAFAQHGPTALVNGYWSPLFPGLIGTTYRALPPTIDTLYPIAHIVAFALFVVTTLVFHRLLTAVRERLGLLADTPDVVQVLTVAVAWSSYALYILKGIGVQLMTPDMGVSAIAFWIAAESLSLGAERWPTERWIRAGVVLGIGYWWKAILFPVGLAWYAMALFVAWRRRDGLRGPAVGAFTYAALALLLVVPISLQVGRITFGETGRLNYLWYANGAPYVWERCRPAGVGDASAEPFGRIMRDSVIVETPLTCRLSSPAAGATMPLWDDPSRYYRDAHTRVDVVRQMRAIRNNLTSLGNEIGTIGPVLFVALAIIGLIATVSLARRPGRAEEHLRRAAAALLFALTAAPVAFYLLVYVEFRHLAPFFMITWVFVPWLAVLAWGSRARFAIALLAVTALADIVTKMSDQTLMGLALARGAVTGRAPDRVPTTQVVARALRAAGIAPATRVASLNNEWNPEWAQLAELRIRAHVPQWTTALPTVLVALRDSCARAAWDAALRASGIEAVVARIPVGLPIPPEFEQLAQTGFYLHRVAAIAAPCAAQRGGAPTRSSS